MPQMVYDALVIGGGPGGSAAATYLARAGKRVLVLEKETFPRFHVGESLLPYNHLIFEEMGVLPTLEAAGFIRKLGAQFHLGNASKSVSLTFGDSRFARRSMAFQVERATFDHLLLKHARASGADVREGWTVSNFSRQDGSMSVQATNPKGESETFTGRFLIDASGRGNVTGNLEGLRFVHPRLKKLALFGHFEGVKTPADPKAGDIVIVRLEDKWFWLIPLSPQKVSVGCVMDQAEFARAGLPPAELFTRIWRSSADLRARLRDARLLNTLHTTTDFSYYNRRLAGPRLLRVGDAAGFMDPIFSAGVYLAMNSGRLASRLVLESLAAGDEGGARLKAYERRVFRAMRFYWDMVEAFYTRPFMELFLEPRSRIQLADAIVAILAGEMDGGWKLDWRRRVFFWLIKIQARCPLVPRISFAETPPHDSAHGPKRAPPDRSPRGSR